MIVALVSIYLVGAVLFFGALAYAARQPIPVMEAADLMQGPAPEGNVNAHHAHPELAEVRAA